MAPVAVCPLHAEPEEAQLRGISIRRKIVSYATIMVRLDLGRLNADLMHIAGGLAERFHAGVIGIAACQPLQFRAFISQPRSNSHGRQRGQLAERPNAPEVQCFRGLRRAS